MAEHRHYGDSNSGPEWGTPPWLVKPLGQALGGFDLDPASGAEPEFYADWRYTGSMIDGLAAPWFGDVWLNPPYGRGLNRRWGEKAAAEAERVDSLTALVPASTSTDWWQENYANADILTWVDRRLKFHGSGEHNASFASVICSWIDEPPDEYMQHLHEIGAVTYTNA